MVLLYCQPSNGHLCIWLQLAIDAASSHLEFSGSACTLFTARLSHLCLTSRTSTQALLYLVKSWPFSLAASMLLPPRSEVKRCVCHRAKPWLKLMLMMMKLPIVRAAGFGGGVGGGCGQMRRAAKVQVTYILAQRCCRSAFQWRCEKHY